jgi:hypothetical protein
MRWPQPTIEKRFSQLKTDFEVAPVYFKDVRRIRAPLSVYFLALLVEAMAWEEIESLSLAEGTASDRVVWGRRAPPWVTHGGRKVMLVTQLTDLQRRANRSASGFRVAGS